MKSCRKHLINFGWRRIAFKIIKLINVSQIVINRARSRRPILLEFLHLYTCRPTAQARSQGVSQGVPGLPRKPMACVVNTRFGLLWVSPESKNHPLKQYILHIALPL